MVGTSESLELAGQSEPGPGPDHPVSRRGGAPGAGETPGTVTVLSGGRGGPAALLNRLESRSFGTSEHPASANAGSGSNV
eukprot:751313-Hanusia_phi.AAC.1